MSAVAGIESRDRGGPSLRTRIAAVAVVVALAALAAYALFSGPTTVPVSAPSKAAPTRQAPPRFQGEPEREGGERGD